MTNFLQAILDGGIRNPNYFNGRVLTAQDMRDGQAAEQERARRLGQALGEGVAYGLFVSQSGANLQVTPGRAFNRRGDALGLNAPATLALAPLTQAGAGPSPFAPCPPTTTTGGISPGFYLLAITVATELAGQAPSSTLNGGVQTCTARYEVEGVQFKMISLPFTDTGTPETRRNRLAHACFGTADVLAAAADPFVAPARYGLIDDVREDGSLTECDVPLAVFHWSSNALQFVDVWPARRPLLLASGITQWPLPAVPAAGDEAWPQHAGARRAAEGLASFLQFQGHVEKLRSDLGAPESAVARTHFSYLPAAGYLPLTRTARKGFQWPAFFARSTADAPATLDAAFLRELFHRSFYIDAIHVPNAGPVPVDLYTVEGAGSDRPYIVFTRREPIAVLPAEEEEEPPAEEEPGDGSLTVAVINQQDQLLPSTAVASVTARDAKGVIRSGRLYKGKLDQVTMTWLNKVVGKTLALQFRAGVNTHAIFVFGALPAGNHTVTATPAPTILLQANSVQVTVLTGATKRIAIALSKRRPEGPKDTDTGTIKPHEPWGTQTGHIVKELVVDKQWVRPPGVVDPPPEWVVDPPPDVIVEIEAVLGRWLEDYPGLVATNPEVFVRPDYDPAAVYDEPYAYVKTRDGTTAPMVLVGGDQALPGDVPATSAGLRDLDAVTYETQFRGNGLANLDALAGAWTGLVSEQLGMDQAGAASLVGEAREAVQSLLTGARRFEIYPGIDRAASESLSRSFADDVALANATPEAVLDTLGGTGAGYSLGFATRLVSRAKANVAPEAWSLNAIDVGPAGEAALQGLGVRSLGGLVSADEATRKRIQDTLHLNEDALNRLSLDAQTQMAAERVRTAPAVGVAALQGVTPERATTLVRSGLGTVSALANADRADVARRLGVSTSEATDLVNRAIAASGGASVAKVPGITAEKAEQLRSQGILSVGDLTRANMDTVVSVLGDETLANRVQSGANVIATRVQRVGLGLR